MASRISPYVDNTGLVFAYDLANIKRSYLGKPATNFYTNGHFAGGTGITQEGGSNPTNTIIELTNPGDSPYVLRQNGNYTEYQINLTSQLSSNTTYVMSGWYAESPDYNGSSMMFHSRAFSASGNHVALDVGLYNVLRTVVVGGLTWKYCYATITTPSDYNADFNWYVGYGQPSHTGYRYYTNLMMEVGTTPSQFVNGTRSATQGLRDLTGNSTIDLTNVSFDANAQMTFDGTDDQIVLDDYASSIPYGGTITVETIVKFYSFTPNDVIVAYGGNNTNFGWLHQYEFTAGLMFGIQNNPSYGAAQIGTEASQQYLNKFIHMVGTYDGTTVRLYINGNSVASQSYAAGIPQSTTFRIGNESGRSYYSNMDLPLARIYNRALPASEIQQNFNAIKGRYGL